MTHPDPIDLIEVEPGVYEPRLHHEVEQLTATPAKRAPSHIWLAALICFVVSAAMGAEFLEAVMIALIGAYVQYVMVVALRGSGR